MIFSLTNFKYLSETISRKLFHLFFYSLKIFIFQFSIKKAEEKKDLEHFFRSLAQNLNACIHLSVKYGKNDHHKIEAAIKAFAVAWRTAVSFDRKQRGMPSTKGTM